LPPEGVKNERFAPPGQPQPRRWPKRRRRDAWQEEQRLRSMGPEVEAYLDYALKVPGVRFHQFTRALFAFSRQVTCQLFVRAVSRALRYRIAEIETLRKIAWIYMTQEECPLPQVDVDEDFQQRPVYQEGRLTEEPDLSVYDAMFDTQDEPDKQDKQDEPGKQDENPSDEKEQENG
jgi:hypothetical protein